MGRKKKVVPPAKEHVIAFRVTNDLYMAISTDAKRAHLSVSEYCRQVATNRRITIHEEIVFDSKELLEILGDMGKIGSNLNQIAHHLNGGGDISNNLKSEIYQGIIALYKIRDMVRDLAGEYRENHSISTQQIGTDKSEYGYGK